MAAECLTLEQLFEIIGHANEIELHCRSYQVDPGRMDVSVDQALLVDASNGEAHLPEDAEHLNRREWTLAEGLPVLRVLRALLGKVDEAAWRLRRIKNQVVLVYLEDVRMPDLGLTPKFLKGSLSSLLEDV